MFCCRRTCQRVSVCVPSPFRHTVFKLHHVKRNVKSAATSFSSLFLRIGLKLKLCKIVFPHQRCTPMSLSFQIPIIESLKADFFVCLWTYSVLACCASALTQLHPSRGFYVIRTFYSWCKQTSRSSTPIWTPDGVFQPSLDLVLSMKLSDSALRMSQMLYWEVLMRRRRVTGRRRRLNEISWCVCVCVLFFLLILCLTTLSTEWLGRIHLSWSGKNGLTCLDVKTPLTAVAWPIALPTASEAQ